MTPNEFFQYLSDNAKGEARAVKASVLVKRLGNVDDRDLRGLAFQSCLAGNPVCTSNDGYFVPGSMREGFDATDRLESQAKAMFARVTATRKAIERVFGPADLFPAQRGA